VTFFWGKVYDSRGFRFSSNFALLWLIAGYILLYFFKTYVPVFVGSLLMMCGYLSGMAVFGAKIRDLTPSGKAGMFQGIRIFSQVLLPGVIGPYIGKTVLKSAEMIANNDGTFSFLPNQNIFLASLVVILLAFACIFIKKDCDNV
jgi:MFS family permease